MGGAAVRVRIVAVDETRLRVCGKSRSVGVVVGRDGRMLGLELPGPGFDYGQWFQELADQLGVEVVVTDDAREYAKPIDNAGLGRQQCMALVRRTLGRWQGLLKPALPRKLLRLAVHLPERWRQMTLHQREPGVPNSANWLKGRFGRIKPRYRLT